MEVSSRYSLAAAVFVALCAIPVWYHALEAPVSDECRDPNAFFLSKRLGTAIAIQNQWRFEEGDAKGRVLARSGERLRVRIFRVREVSKLYGSPMSFGYDSMSYLVPRELRPIEVDGTTLPVHWSRFDMDGEGHLEAWTFAMGDEPLRHPFGAWAGHAWTRLFGGNQPLTVMIASAVARPENMENLEETAEGWFVSAWKQLRAACDS